MLPENDAVSNVSPILRRFFIPLTVSLPLAVMLLLFAKDYYIVGSEMKASNLHPFIFAVAAPLVILTAGLFYTMHLKKRGEIISIAGALSFLVVTASAFATSMFMSFSMRPDVETFILPFERWPIYFATFYMPPIVYMLVALCELIRGRRANWTAVVCIVVIPLMMYLACQLPVFSTWTPNALLLMFVLVACFLLFTYGVIKFSILFFRWSFNLRHSRAAGIIVVGAVLPTAGLMLNSVIPFPVDLQCNEVYALLAINVLVLCLGVFGNKFLDIGGVFLRGAVYPFPLYFFLLFLPWLPLYVPVIIAAGLGFLILAPTLLFIMQNVLYASDFSKLAQYIPKWKLTVSFLLGFAVIPAVFTLGALRDRTELDSLVDYYFHSPYVMPLEAQEKAYDAKKAERILRRLKNALAGVEYPFISELYNRIVFSDLVLSRDRLDRMYLDLVGNYSGSGFANSMIRLNFFGNSAMLSSSPLRDRAPFNASLNRVAVEPSQTGCVLTAVVDGSTSANGEYVADIRIPNGVYVNGFALKIKGEFVPGRTAERKTALWIYEKITTAHRDPALLFYRNPNLLRLLVFPVNMKDPREVRIELLYPDGVSPEIVFDGRRIKLPSYGKEIDSSLPSSGAAEGAVVKPFERPLELLFLIDRSEKNDKTNHLAMMNKALAAHPEVESFRVASGIASCGGVSKRYPRNGAVEAYADFEKTYRPSCAGFAMRNVIKGALLAYLEAENGKSCPVVVTITRKKPDVVFNFTDFAYIAPEFPYIMIGYNGGYFSMLESAMLPAGSRPVKRPVVKSANNVYAPEDGGIISVPAARKNPAYSAAEKLFDDSKRLALNPDLESELLTSILTRSRADGVLVPQASYIVLETQAQWKTLDEVEKNKLTRSSAFDIEEVKTPEPPSWILALVFSAIVFIMRLMRKTRRKA